jgi:hypothetical protein
MIAVAAVIFGLWCALTVGKNAELFARSPWLMSVVGRLDPVVPRWTFFAPNPLVKDYHLLYRDVWESGTSAWRVAVGKEPAPGSVFWRALWNPGGRQHKALLDVVGAVNQIAELERDKGPTAVLHYTVPYLLLLNFVSGLSHDPRTTGVQFLVMAQAMDTPAHPIILSSIHSLD